MQKWLTIGLDLCYHAAMENRSEVIPIGKYDTQTEWKAKNTSLITIRLNHKTDADILLKLSQVESKQGYLKALIRKDLTAVSHLPEKP